MYIVLPYEAVQLLCILCTTSSAATAILPLSIHVAMLGAFMLLNGIAIGALDNGTPSYVYM